MGYLFATSGKQPASARNKPSDGLLHQLGCRACPLNKVHLDSPKMPPSGAREPLIYVIGEAPGQEEDQEGRQFVGSSGRMLRPMFPNHLRAKIRWSNTISCWPGEGNPTPNKIMVECCRPRLSDDIQQTKPTAIFGFGAVPLQWTDKPSGIMLWRGRRFPIRVGSHTCWYFAFTHPAFILHSKKSKSGWVSDDEIALRSDIRRAIEEVENGLPEPIIHTKEMVRSDITCITGRSAKDLSYVVDFLEYAATIDVVGYDIETQNLRPYNKNSAVLTRAVSAHDKTVAFAWKHPESGWNGDRFEKLEKAWVRFLRCEVVKAVHNLSYEMEWDCYYYGRDIARAASWEDTQTQAFVLDERIGEQKPGAMSLEFITLQNFGTSIKKFSPKFNMRRMSDEPLKDILPYNGIDAKYHRLNFEVQRDRIVAEGLEAVYREKVRQVPTVVLTQIKGLPTNKEVTRQLAAELLATIEGIVAKINQLADVQTFTRLTNRPFNPASHDDVVVMLRDVLKTTEGRSELGGWSTKEEVLSKIDLPVTRGILEYRRATKLKSTYVDPMLPGSPIMYDDGLLHTSLGTTFTETGRLNSEDPNLQNIPIRTAEGRNVRRQFESEIVASFDYGQIDARIIACGSRDPSYCKALWENYDIHAEWARRLALKVPSLIGGKKFLDDKEVFGDFRNKVKSAWVFALFYGAALRTTAGRFGVEESDIKDLYELFWQTFEGVQKWQEVLIKQFEERGYVQMLGGLRRRAPLGRGQIINSPVQGATNRIVMHAMNRLSETGDPLLQANIQIHDDLKFHFDSIRDYEDSVPRIVDIMLDGSDFNWFCVPLVVEIKDGPNWQDMSKVGDYASHRMIGWPVRPKEFI
jgi:uracil-DNA glycosylase family 4